jgi:2-phosphoglycerate kinase
MITSPILFIGPVRAGKSTIARLIAFQLNIPHVSLDELRWEYYREIGYDEKLAKQIRQQGGFLAVMYYRQLFDVHSVVRVLGDHPEAVIDFGAGLDPLKIRSNSSAYSRCLSQSQTSSCFYLLQILRNRSKYCVSAMPIHQLI